MLLMFYRLYSVKKKEVKKILNQSVQVVMVIKEISAL